jgi:hypothetical protein
LVNAKVTLTPVGAEQKSNIDGSIPEWTGGLTVIPKGYSRQKPDVLPNPFVAEELSYQISHKNLDSYRHLLSDGHAKLLADNPESYVINVFPTHRSAAYPDSIYQATTKNTDNTRLNESGSGLENYQSGVPFKHAQSAIEVIWNHITRYRGQSVWRKVVSATVQEDGRYKLVKSEGQVSFSHSLKDADSNTLFYLKSRIVAPTRMAGDVLLIHETLDQLKESRKAWVYSSSQRRVRRAPDFAYDSAMPFADGFVVADQVDMFNGAPDRYDWKLLGKKELLIPYNSYDIFSKKIPYKDLLKAGHIEPKYVRFEKHRVWVIEASLKKNSRHIYGKRVFYIDEDTWQISVIDYFDGHKKLWRMGEAYALYFYQEKIPLYAFEAIYDLNSKRYVTLGISNEERKSIDFGIKAKRRDYTPNAIRREGR